LATFLANALHAITNREGRAPRRAWGTEEREMLGEFLVCASHRRQ
jgi:hypothetical protein